MTNLGLSKKRQFYPEDIKFNRWRQIRFEFDSLLNMKINNANDLELLINKSSEGLMILLDFRNNLFLKMKSKTSVYNYIRFFLFQNKIIKKGLIYVQKWEDKVNNSPYKTELDQNKYGHFLKIIQWQKRFFHSKNVKLQALEEKLSNQYGLITSRMGTKFRGKYCTLANLEKFVLERDRQIRQEAFYVISQLYLKHKNKLDDLFDKLLSIRHEIATNAQYGNYRDYAHEVKGRFSYTVEDVLNFHKIIIEEVLPVVRLLNQRKVQAHQLKELKPWDARVEKVIFPPYLNEIDLLEKCLRTMNDIKPEYGQHLQRLITEGCLDIFNRPKKSLGAYNIPLFEKGASYIFANFIKQKASYQDVAILHHEFGHALHNYFTQKELIMAYRNFPSEISELASLTIELIAVEHLQFYYPEPQVRKAVKEQQFERLLKIVVSRCMGDAFQHWVYKNAGHSPAEREKAYIKYMEDYNEGISWKGVEDYQSLEYLKILHYFQVPFYYIEYAFAGLGALDLYRQYKISPSKLLNKYEGFLKSGYNKDVHLIYEQVGTCFPFKKEKVKELMKFVCEELELEAGFKQCIQ